MHEKRNLVLSPNFSRARDGPQRRMGHEERPDEAQECPHVITFWAKQP
jgi:hypothetical protein